MIVRVKDSRSRYTAIKDFEGIFGDKEGDDFLTLGAVDAREIDEANRRFKFIASTDSVDLDDEIIAQGAFHELRDYYLADPVMLVNHQHILDNGLCPVAAKCLQLQTQKNPVWGVGRFTQGAVGRDHAAVVLAGDQRSVSVGFRSREIERLSGRSVHTKSLLMEISLVTGRANPEALVVDYVAGKIGHVRQRTADTGESKELMQVIAELRERQKEMEAALGLRADSEDDRRTMAREVAECFAESAGVDVL